MNVSYKWLKEYVDFDLTPQETADVLTSCGLEVDALEEVQSIKGGLKGLALFEASCDVKEYEFIGTCVAIGLAQFYRVACASQVHEVRSLHGLSVFHVKTRDDSLCQTFVTLNFDH